MTTTTAPIVGNFATYGIGGDRYVVEIIKATPKTVTVRTTSTIHNGGSYAKGQGDTFAVVSNPNGRLIKFTLRANGRWTMVGGNYGSLNLDIVDDYRDPSF